MNHRAFLPVWMVGTPYLKGEDMAPPAAPPQLKAVLYVSLKIAVGSRGEIDKL